MQLLPDRRPEPDGRLSLNRRPKPTAVAARLAVLVLAAGLCGPGCALRQAVGNVPDDARGEATMLVAATDGSVAEQRADIDADLCLRSIPLDLTICYTRGAPRLDPVTREVTSYEMIATMMRMD